MREEATLLDCRERQTIHSIRHDTQVIILCSLFDKRRWYRHYISINYLYTHDLQVSFPIRPERPRNASVSADATQRCSRLALSRTTDVKTPATTRNHHIVSH